MTLEELTQSLNLTLTAYSKALDDNIMALWEGLFINFHAGIFRAACFKVIESNKFFPNPKEIIEIYQCIRQEAKRERYEKLKENQRLLTTGQAHCHLCDNSGSCFYTISGYEYAARCICSHGQDLNKFSEPQIKQEYRPELREHYSERDKLAIRRGKNPFYLPTIQEVLKDDFAVFEARRKDRYLSRENLTDEQRIEMLKKMYGAISA